MLSWPTISVLEMANDRKFGRRCNRLESHPRENVLVRVSDPRFARSRVCVNKVGLVVVEFANLIASWNVWK